MVAFIKRDEKEKSNEEMVELFVMNLLREFAQKILQLPHLDSHIKTKI